MQETKICCLYSGSGGNSTYVSAGGSKILIDAGKSAKTLCAALTGIGEDIRNIDAIFVTHEHSDHVSALRTLSHKYGIPIYISLASAEIYRGLCDEKLCRCLKMFRGSDLDVTVKGLHVKAFCTPHDSMASVGFRLCFDNGNGDEKSIGFATDTGHVSETMLENLTGCYAAVIESNHDLDMLRRGPYPIELKQRIAADTGHLSNEDAARLALHLCKNGAKHIMLAHLSQDNNKPELAYACTRLALGDAQVELKVAKPDAPVWFLGGNG